MSMPPDAAARRSPLGSAGAWLGAAGNMLLATVAVLGFAASGAGPKAVLARVYDQRYLILVGLLAQGVGLLMFALAWLADPRRGALARAAGVLWLGYVALAAAFVVLYANAPAPAILPILLGGTTLLVGSCVVTLAALLADRGSRGAAAVVAAWAFGAAALVTLGAAVLLGAERWLPGLLALAALGLVGSVALGAAALAWTGSHEG